MAEPAVSISCAPNTTPSPVPMVAMAVVAVILFFAEIKIPGPSFHSDIIKMYWLKTAKPEAAIIPADDLERIFILMFPLERSPEMRLRDWLKEKSWKTARKSYG